MKKLVILLSLLFFTINSSFAQNPADWLNKLEDNFSPECYEYYNKIDKSKIRNNSTNEKYKTYKINLSDLI